MAPFLCHGIPHWPDPTHAKAHQSLLLESLVRHWQSEEYALAYETAQVYLTYFPDGQQASALKRKLPGLQVKALEQYDRERWRYEPSLDQRQQAYLVPLEGPPFQLFFQSSPNIRDQMIVFIGPNDYQCPEPCFIQINGASFKATAFAAQPYALQFSNPQAIWRSLSNVQENTLEAPGLNPLKFRIQGYDPQRWTPAYR